METYSTYEAKARFSELLRKVRAGQVVRVTHRGEVVAEVRPTAQSGSSLEARLDDLETRGALVPAPCLFRRKRSVIPIDSGQS